MAGLQEYKCPCCGGAIAFDSTIQKMKCPYCDTEFEMDALKGYDDELQEEQALRQLIGTLRDAQEDLAAQHGKRVPMLVKIAPDLSDSDIDAVARVLGDMQVDGVIATNTTVSRLSVQYHPLARETGGLSGAPLMGQATLVLRRLRTRLPDTIPLIGVGGILSGADAVAKMSAGASLVQCYTGLVYRGPELIRECVEAIRRRREAPSRGPVAPE